MVNFALSWRSHFGLFQGPCFGDFFCLFLSSLLVSFLITVWTFSKPILEAMVDENRPKREANDSKQPSKASKTPKAAFSKKHKKKHWVFHYFWQQRPLKNVSRGPRCPQWFTHRNPNHKRKKPKIKAISFQNFETKQNKQIWTPKHQTKRTRKWPHFWDPLPPHLRGPNNAPPKNKREG